MRTCFFIPSDILFAEQVSIERNNSVVVIFRHLLPLLPNLYFISCLSLIFLYVMFSLLFFYVMFGLGVDSWRERAISEVRGLRDERGPTQLGIYPRTSLSWIPGTRCACPRMTEEKIILLLPALFFFLSLPDLIRQSRDSPVKPGNDRKE